MLRKLRLIWYASAVRRFVDKIAMRVLRQRINGFAKSITSEAKERGLVSNTTMHELDGMIDRRLWPEHYR